MQYTSVITRQTYHYYIAALWSIVKRFDLIFANIFPSQNDHPEHILHMFPPVDDQKQQHFISNFEFHKSYCSLNALQFQILSTFSFFFPLLLASHPGVSLPACFSHINSVPVMKGCRHQLERNPSKSSPRLLVVCSARRWNVSGSILGEHMRSACAETFLDAADGGVMAGQRQGSQTPVTY